VCFAWGRHCTLICFLRENLTLRHLLGALEKLWKATISFVMSVCVHAITRLPLKRIYMKFHIWVFFKKNLFRKFSFHYNLKRITGILHEDQYKLISSRWIILRMRNISGKSCIEDRNTNFLCSIFFKFYRLWDNVEKYCIAGQMPVWCMLDT